MSLDAERSHQSLALALALALAFAISTLALVALAPGCARSIAGGPQNGGDRGQVSLAFTLESGGELQAVTYTISGNAISAITRSLDVTKMSHVTDTVADLPAGAGYAISADATSVDGFKTCHAQTSFEILANQTALVSLTMLCRSGDAGVGGLSLSGSFDNCPVITAQWLASKRAALGDGFNAGVTATDPDTADDTRSNPLSYLWKINPESLGTLAAAANKPTQRFVCNQVGKGVLSVTVGDGSCNRTAAADVECVMYGSPPAASSCVGISSYSVGARYEQLRLGETLPVYVIASSGAARTIEYTWVATPENVGSFTDAHAARTTFTCATAGSATLAVRAADGVCAPDVRDPVAKVTCKPNPSPRPDGGVRDGSPTDGAGAGGAGGAGGGSDASPPGGGCPTAEPASPSAACDTCTAENVNHASDGCCDLSGTDQALCVAVVKCLADNAKTCTSSGDATSCFCGGSGGNCFSKQDAANGPCTTEVYAAAKSRVPADIQAQFTNMSSPLGRAVNLTATRGSFCSTECGIP